MSKNSFQNRTEEFTYELAQETFLSYWSYANPRRSPTGPELCDVLVVCDPDILIISVKEFKLSEDAEPQVAYKRWVRKAVENSAKQLYGATRWLEGAERVIRHNGADGLALPAKESRRVHRISVSLGGARRIPLPQGDFGKGIVHVFDEASFPLFLRELDTVTDFVDYLRAKEELMERCPQIQIDGGEENLLALYLHRGRRFDDGCPNGPISGNLWEEFAEKPEYQRKLQADQKDSYVWDGFIEHFAGHSLEGTLEFSNGLDADELAYRVMARESRFGRRVLGKAFREFRELAKQAAASSGDDWARMLESAGGVGYVFYNFSPDRSRDKRRTYLEMRCFVARGRLECPEVIGIGVNVVPGPEGHCEDLCYLHLPEWTAEDEQRSRELQENLGMFKSPKLSRQHEDEYPEA